MEVGEIVMKILLSLQIRQMKIQKKLCPRVREKKLWPKARAEKEAIKGKI